ncbi:uncharacterized protein METZ01_LOCUS175531, partial [marine metagenome]
MLLSYLNNEYYIKTVHRSSQLRRRIVLAAWISSFLLFNKIILCEYFLLCSRSSTLFVQDNCQQ